MSGGRRTVDGEERAPESGAHGAMDVAATIVEATAEQPGPRAALAAALRRGPSHAYLFRGPSGSGKAAAARAFAAELLAAGAADPDDARRRALLDPSPHPDLAWLRPPGNHHLVDDVRAGVIAAAPLRPFEGSRRVFVIEAAEAMAEESQNALLKTLEEPPAYAHIVLISSEPAGLLETVRSRCQPVAFAPLPPEAVRRRLGAELPGASEEALVALAELAGGDLGRARMLATPTGERLRDAGELCARQAVAGGLGEQPWKELLALAGERGKQEAALVAEAASQRAEALGRGRDADRARREGADAAKRAERRARTEAIDTALGLVAAWFADIVAVAEGAPELVRNADRRERLSADASGVAAPAARRAAEVAMEMRGRLRVNVNEELALEALLHRAAHLLGEARAVRY